MRRGDGVRALLIGVIQLGTWSTAQAFNMDAELKDISPRGNYIKGLDIPRKKSLRVKVRNFGDRQGIYVVLEGQHNRKLWKLAIAGRKIRKNSQGRFRALIAVKKKIQKVQLLAISPKGSIERQTFRITFKNWDSYEKKKLKRLYLIPGVGVSMNTFHDRRFQEVTDFTITPKLQIFYLLAPPHWDLALSVFMNAASISTTPNNVSMKFIGINFRGGYNFSLGKDWEASVLAGTYLLKMVVEPSFGFSNLTGPQLFPVVKKHLTNGRMVGAYGKFSPIANNASLLSLDNHELAFGAYYVMQLKNGHPISITVDYAQLNLTFAGAQMSGTSLTLGGAYGF